MKDRLKEMKKAWDEVMEDEEEKEQEEEEEEEEPSPDAEDEEDEKEQEQEEEHSLDSFVEDEKVISQVHVLNLVIFNVFGSLIGT